MTRSHLRLPDTLVPALVACGLLAASHSALAQPSGPPQGWTQRVNVGAVYQTDADIENSGGSFDVARYFIGADFTRVINQEAAISFGLGAGLDSYGFSDIASPWGDITRFEASFSYSRKLNQDWSLRITPSIQSHFEDGASMSDGIVAGLIAAATHTFHPDLRLGLGLAAFSGLEETRVFPFLAITWKISETWSVQNPFRPGPAGPAGVEVVKSGDAWEFAFGGAYRSYRFRLADDGPVSQGIGEYNGVPLFVRASRELTKGWEVDLYAGMVVGGNLELEDESGSDLAKSDFDPAPLVALTFTGRF